MLKPRPRPSALSKPARLTTPPQRPLYGLAKTVPVLDKCPDPECACAPMPAGLDIDRTTPLEGTMAPYDLHLSVQSPTLDWPSRFEDGESLAAKVKNLLGRKGVLYNPNFTTLVTAQYTEDLTPSDPLINTISLFPHFKSYTLPNPSNSSSLAESVKSLLPPAYFATATNPNPTTTTLASSDLTTPQIQICGHASRDSRCGILGPLLKSEFERAAHILGIPVSTSLITHIGGHKYAGNVIVYIPPSYARDGNRLAGQGVWYGRVEPRHVEGILKAVGRGQVIREIFRGAVGPLKAGT